MVKYSNISTGALFLIKLFFCCLVFILCILYGNVDNIKIRIEKVSFQSNAVVWTCIA
jgi:hypothetical protein